MDNLAAAQLADGTIWAGLAVVACGIALLLITVRQDKKGRKRDQGRAFRPWP